MFPLLVCTYKFFLDGSHNLLGLISSVHISLACYPQVTISCFCSLVLLPATKFPILQPYFSVVLLIDNVNCSEELCNYSDTWSVETVLLLIFSDDPLWRYKIYFSPLFMLGFWPFCVPDILFQHVLAMTVLRLFAWFVILTVKFMLKLYFGVI